MKKILVFGRNGQLGRCLSEKPPKSCLPVFLSRADADFSGETDFAGLLNRHDADLVINAAAYTAVDLAEGNNELAAAINTNAVRSLGAATAARGTPLIHMSTDYVFAGDLEQGAYSEDHATEPTGVYGSSKLAGERELLAVHDRAFIFRTAWVYSAYGSNFLKTMLALAKTRDELQVVGDQRGTPTSAHDLAAALWQVVELLMHSTGNGHQPGTYHMVSQGDCTWHDFALEIFSEAAKRGHKVPSCVNRIVTADFPTRAKRPANSRLSTSKLKKEFGIELPDWRAGIPNVLDQLEGGDDESW